MIWLLAFYEIIATRDYCEITKNNLKTNIFNTFSCRIQIKVVILPVESKEYKRFAKLNIKYR